MAMLKGERVSLRTVLESDLPALYDAHIDVSTRGQFFPLGTMSEPAFRGRFAEHGFWQREEGMLLIIDEDDRVVGHIEFFMPINYWDSYELSYQLYDGSAAGRGYTTEAVQLMVDFLFHAKKRNRIQLVIVPENDASRRIADKCGFVLEGTARGAFFNGGRNHDVLVYSLLRDDPRPWRSVLGS
jgi:ribosomal-protein-alanine N-acetyltransferase